MKLDKDYIISIEDKNLLTDSFSDHSDSNIIDNMKHYKKNNVLVLYDENGKEVARTTNKVVAGGRVEQLENMFRTYTISEKNPEIVYEKPNNLTNTRWISVFGVGSGGTPLSEGNNPYIVNPSATELSTPLQFRLENVSNPKVKYYDNYKKKDFTSIYLNWDKSLDDVYALLVCELDYNDLTGKIVNEIGLYNCTHVFEEDKLVNKTNFSLYAKANMPSINKSPLQNTSAYKIAYKVFI